jgi:hypothetical protein
METRVRMRTTSREDGPRDRSFHSRFCAGGSVLSGARVLAVDVHAGAVVHGRCETALRPDVAGVDVAAIQRVEACLSPHGTRASHFHAAFPRFAETKGWRLDI